MIVPLSASDGFVLDAWHADPKGLPRGGVVILQENAGLTRHICDVADEYAAEGYVAIAPALYDRVGEHLVFDYSKAGQEQRRATRSKVDMAKAMLDCEAAVRAASAGGKVGVIGFCWGGSVAWMAAAHVKGLSCAVSYYGSAILNLLGEKPQCPFMFHWGDRDETLSLEKARQIEAAFPDIPSYVYEAGHAFNNPLADFFPQAARTARERTLAFLDKQLS